MTTAKIRKTRRSQCSRTVVPLAILLGLSLLAQAAQAKQSQVTLMRDDRQLVDGSDGVRNQTLDEMKNLGVDVVQIMINWDKASPNCTSYNWSRYDKAVSGIQERGMQPILNPTGPAPRCGSTAKSGPLRGQQPNVKRFGAFAKAAAGHFSDVNIWGVWNEPNQGGWLIQSKLSPILGTRIRWSPHLYRQLFLAGSQQIRAAGHADATIFVGDTAPLGSSDLTATRPTRPVEFWREFFCLDKNYRPYRGIALKARGCPNPFPKIKADVVAHHPYTRGGAQSPYARGTPGDLPLAKTNALVSLLNKAADRGRIGPGIPIWFTEYGLQTRPPDFHLSVSLDQQAEYINEAEYIGYKNSRVESYTQYEMVDDPLQTQYPKSSPQRYGGFQTGLKFEDGREKPAYDAFRLPIVVTRNGSGVTVWGAVRPKIRPTTVQIEAGSGLSFEPVGPPVSVTADNGYFEKSISSSAGTSWRLSWKAPDGKIYYSRTAKVTSKQ